MKAVLEMKAVLVTTASRGVFFGYYNEEEARPAGMPADVVALLKCRNVLYWSADVKGFRLKSVAQYGPRTFSKRLPSNRSLPLMEKNEARSRLTIEFPITNPRTPCSVSHQSNGIDGSRDDG